MMEQEQFVLRYPHIHANFRKLEKPVLLRILKHYGVTPKPDIEQPELAIMTARFFADVHVIENEVVNKFAKTFCKASEGSMRKKGWGRSFHREQLDSEPARPGEQVAVKANTAGENGYILGNCLDYDPNSQTYEIQDEDDVNRVFYSSGGDVKRLEDTAAHLNRGDSILAVFPETTSFYRAIVAKNPKAPQHGNSGWDVVVRFEDDEDETGRAPPRRVPARFVLRRSDIGDDSDYD